MNVLNQTTCKRCGRKLKSKNTIEIGMGFVCWKKYQQENKHKKLFGYNEDNNRNECRM